MSTTQEAPAHETEYDFTPKLSPRWALNLEQVAAVALFGILFVVLNYIPIRGTDIWGHVMYGQWILANGAFPDKDPWMGLAAGVPVVDTAWLSQIIFGAVDRFLGPEALSHLFAIVNIAAYLVFARLFYLQTRRVWLSVACTGLLILVGWSRFATIRPENFAVLCFAVICLLAVRVHLRNDQGPSEQPTPRSFDFLTWLGIPTAFALWANLHGSFVVGIILLGCYLIGRAVEVAWKERDAKAVLADASVRRWIYVVELALAATLLNPHGLDLWIHTLSFGSNENLLTVLEWQPLVVFGVGGRPFAISILLLLVVWRQSQRAIRPAEAIMLLVFGVAALMGIRMLGWYAPVFAIAVAPHIADIARQWLPARFTDLAEGNDLAAGSPALAEAVVDVEDEGGVEGDEEEYVMPPGQSFRYSLVALLLIWIAFALSPISQVIFKKARAPEQLYSPDTPVQLIGYLNQAYEEDTLPTDGQVFQPQWWGDWIVRQGPDELRIFATSNIHLIPPQVWRDYHRVMGVQSGWDGILDRYNVKTIIVDNEQQPVLLQTLNRSSEWESRYQDDQATVFVRSDSPDSSPRSPSLPPQEETI